MVVVSVSLSAEELERFDRLVDHLGYTSRSEAVRDALYRLLAQHRLEVEGTGACVLTLVSDPQDHQGGIHDVTHGYNDVIRTTLHSDVERGCVDILVVQGGEDRVHELVDRLASLRGVRVGITPI